MNLINLLIYAAAPVLLIPRPDWQQSWLYEERGRYRNAVRFFSAGMAILFAIHYFLIDIPAKKEPLSLYMFYRFSVASVGFVVFGLTFLPRLTHSKFAKLPLMVFGGYMVFMQAQSMVWRPHKVPFFYVPFLATFSALMLRLPPFGTVICYVLLVSCGYNAFILDPAESYHLVSASAVGAALLIILRSRVKNDVRTFILTQQNLATQKELIQSQLALTEQLRSFLPKELFLRADYLMREQKMTPLQAMDEVMRPRKALCSVLYSDIRAFTGLTKTGGDDASIKAVIPAQKTCTDIIEANAGVPRLQGDLVYAYFDSSNPVENMRKAILSAFQLYQANEELNQSIDPSLKIRRYVIISFGPVIVGNLGGTEGSKDINVLGDAANIPSRLDLLTKEKKLSSIIERSPVILSSEAFDLLLKFCPSLEYQKVDLSSLNLSLRDFPEEKLVYFLWNTESNAKLIAEEINYSKVEQYLKVKYAKYLEDTNEALSTNRTAA